jgi:hypothetical protein
MAAVFPVGIFAGPDAIARDVLADPPDYTACLHWPYPRGQALAAQDEMDLGPNKSFSTFDISMKSKGAAIEQERLSTLSEIPDSRTLQNAGR